MKNPSKLVFSSKHSQQIKAMEVADIEQIELLDQGSNYTFFATLSSNSNTKINAIYKPKNGEIPLRDFPKGTLFKRERAAYLLSRILKWKFIPPTIIKEGPYGIGSLQYYVNHDPSIHYLNIKGNYENEFGIISIFDWICNNADRKAGHIIYGNDGNIWGIDQGLTFNTEYKMRTVIWYEPNQVIPDFIIEKLSTLNNKLLSKSVVSKEIQELLTKEELIATVQRIQEIIKLGTFPDIRFGRVPWPLL
jgi:uncharacterized repeat protein (TIGR03843 family)